MALPERQNDENDRERYQALSQLEEWLEGPVVFLGFVWLVLLVIELIWGLNPFLTTLSLIIWGIFLVDFTVRLILAPHKSTYLRRNWLTALSLLAPALRILRLARYARIFRAARTARGLRLVKVVGTLNRGMRSLQKSLGRRGFAYAVLLTVAVTFAGAAGLYGLENEVNQNYQTYGDSLWRTAMIMTTMGSDTSPVTVEGRILTFLLAIYAFAIFGYVTATLASFFIGQDSTQNSDGQIHETLLALQAEIGSLRRELRARNDSDQ